jgi:hypothetical protein
MAYSKAAAADRRKYEHEKEMAMINWFTSNEEAPYIAMVLGGLGIGIFARLLSEIIDITGGVEVDDYILDGFTLPDGQKFTAGEKARIKAGKGVVVQFPIIIPPKLPGQGLEVKYTPMYIDKKKIAAIITGNRDPSQVDDVMGTFGGGLAGFGASVIFVKSIFGKEGAKGTGSVLAAAGIVGLGTAATAAIVGKLADDT